MRSLLTGSIPNKKSYFINTNKEQIFTRSGLGEFRIVCGLREHALIGYGKKEHVLIRYGCKEFVLIGYGKKELVVRSNSVPFREFNQSQKNQ